MSWTAKWVLGAAERAVAEHGAAHIEERGQYLRWSIEGNRWVPCCLVGHIAVEAGVEVAQLVRVNSEGVTETARDAFAGRFTDLAIDLLAVAQREADLGHTWGHILDEMRLRWQMIARPEPENAVSSLANPMGHHVNLWSNSGCNGQTTTTAIPAP